MRVLIVTPEYPPHAGGGILKYYALLVKALREAGAQVSVLVSTPFSSFPNYEDQGVDVSFVPLDRVHAHADHLSHLAAAPMYRRWIGASRAAADWVAREADRFDVIEVTDFGLLFAALLGLPSRPPVVVAFHGSVGQIADHEPQDRLFELDGALARLTEAILLGHADGLYAYGPANAEEWSHRLNRHVSFIPPPLPLPTTARPVSRDRDALVVGRIQSWKGPRLVCDALEALGPRVPSDLVVKWVGRDTRTAGGQRSMSDWLATAHPDTWNRRVIPVGPRGAAEVEALQASARFVVVPSYWDVFNLTLAEAMALGQVVVTSTGVGASYLIEHGVNGFCANADPMEFGEALLAAHTLSDSARTEFGAAARATIARELDPVTVAAQHLEFQRNLPGAAVRPVPTPWVREFLESSADRVVGVEHLNHVGIRELSAHLKTRLLQRLRP